MANETMTREQMLERIAQLESERKNLKAMASNTLRFKVSEKGALSVYGLQRFPVTLYKEQWKRLFDSTKAIEQFAKDNDIILKTKPIHE